MKNSIFIVLALLLVHCSEDDEISCFTCQYEKRTTSCSSSSFGPWEQGTLTVDYELKDGLSPEQYCNQTYPASDIECAGGCCISFQFRNVSVGSCP
jgi:hypothetical protein